MSTSWLSQWWLIIFVDRFWFNLVNRFKQYHTDICCQGMDLRIGSTHVIKQLLFSIVASILIYAFDLILGPFLTFRGVMGYFWGRGLGSKIVFRYTHVVEQLSFSMFP